MLIIIFKSWCTAFNWQKIASKNLSFSDRVASTAPRLRSSFLLLLVYLRQIFIDGFPLPQSPLYSATGQLKMPEPAREALQAQHAPTTSQPLTKITFHRREYGAREPQKLRFVFIPRKRNEVQKPTTLTAVSVVDEKSQ